MDASVASEPAASPDEAPTSRGETKLINLALQSGGAHGAFTWGVLDRLLEDDRIGSPRMTDDEIQRRQQAGR